MTDLQQALKDFVATANSGKYADERVLMSKFPELKGYDIQVLKDFVATSNSGKYRTEEELFAKFPEFAVKKKEQVSPSQQKAQPTSSATGAMGQDGAPVPSAKKGPSLQEQLQSGINLAASAAVASSKPGFTPVPKEEADKALYGKAKVKEGTLGLSGGRSKEVIAKDIQDKYSNLGVRVEQVPIEYRAVGAGDLRVIADDGSQIDINVSSDSKQSASEEAKLQTFLMGKSAGSEKKPITPMEFMMMSRDGISPQEEGKFKRVYSQELVDSSIKFANNELEKTKNGLDKIKAEKSKLEEEAMIGGATPEIEERYSQIQGEYENSIKYANSIASLTDEGIKKAAGENARLLAENGSITGGLYNALLKGTKMLVEGSVDIAAEGLDIVTLGAIGDVTSNGAKTLYTYDKKKAREDRAGFLNDIYDELKSVGTTNEYTTTGNMAWKALFAVPEFIPSLVVPGGASARVAAMWSQGVGRRYEEMDKNPETKNLPEEEKFFMAAGPAYVEARLENFGLTQWLGANKGLASSIFLSAVSKVAPNAGVKGLNRIINAEINNFVLRGAVNTAGAMISEAETGALQNISETAFRDAYEIAKGKNLFKQPGFGEDGFKKALLEDAVMEGLGGMWMAGAVNIAQQTEEYVTGKANTNETFRLVKEILSDKTTASSLFATLKSQMMEGKISKEQAQKVLNNFNDARAIVRELPQDLSEDNQRKAFDLIAEKRKLAKQIEGKDPSLVDKQKTRITAIDQELKNISNAVQEQATSEVPVQPEAPVGGEVAQGEPQAESQVVTEEIIPQEEIATRQTETESKIKRKDLFSDGGTFSNVLGGSGVDSVPTAHSETNGIEFVQFSNPTTGQVDVIMTGTSDSDFVGFYRIYENGKPTNKWSSKFENQSRNKENFKTMISGVQSMLPEGHEYTEKTSISTDGLRVWNQQLDRGYELQFDENGNLITNEVAINGDAIVNELGINVLPGEFENISVTTNAQFNSVKNALLPYLKNFGLNESNIKWEDGTVKVDLPVLKKSSNVKSENEVTVDKQAIAVNSKTEVDAVKNAASDVETGQTFNLDGTVYTGGGLVVPIDSLDTTQEELTPELIADFVEKNKDKIGNDYVKVGIYKFANENKVSIDLNVVVPSENREAALEFGRLSGQESLFDLDTFENIKTGSDGKNTYKFNADQSVEIAKALKSGNIPNVFGDTNFDQAVNNSAQSLKMVAPDLKVIVADNTEDAQLQIAEALSAVAPSQAADVAEGFTTETRGQTVFVNGKPFAIVLDKSQADSKTVGHEAWELMLNDAFGDDQAKFKEFRDEIDRQLRLKGFGDIADALTKFSNQRGYEDVKYSEYMAELGGMLVANGFKQGSLDAKQKSLLQKIGDVINKFAQLFTGKKQFLDEATPDDILGFMITISNKVAKGEDVSKFFRGKESAAKPSVETRSQQAAIEILDGPKFDNKLKEDVASYLNSLRDSEIPPNSTREQLMERFINNVYEEVGYYLYSKPDARSAGLTWYIEDMVEFENKVKVILPELSNEKQYKLFLSILAFTSSGTNPNQNLLYAYNLWNNSKDPKNFEFSKNWAEKKLSFIDKKGKSIASGVIVKETAKEYTVELVDSLGRPEVDGKGNKKYEKISKASMKAGYPKPTGYTNRGKIIVGQLEKLEKLYADLGSIDAVVKWLETPHPIAELRKYNESVPDVNGKGPGKTNKEYDPSKNVEGERNGAFIFGEKIGSFYQNMIGIGETITMDLWWSRTWNRYMGTMINTVSGKKEIQEVPRSDRERNIMREAVKMVAEDLNLQVSELQAAIWYFEQELWTKSGNDSPSYSYVTAIDDLTEKLKVDEETRTKLRAAEADLTEAEKRRQNAAERAAAVVASKGGELPKVKVTSRSQKSVPAVVDEVLTDDGKGNYVFVHYSDELRDTIKPMSGSNKNFTSREEVAAISSVGGVAMYYTKQGQKEQGVGNVAHTVLVPKDKVYFYGTTERGKVSNDPENFYPEARRRFQEYKNMNNPTRPTEYAFDSNNAAAWVGKVAAENGYDMLVTNWGAPTSYRAQTVKELKPEAEYTGFKQIPEPTYEVGDEVFLYGKYATLTDVKPDVLTYEVENAFGGVDSGKFPLTVMTRDKIIMVQKAKPVITVRAQKKDTYTNKQYGEMSENGVVFHGGTKAIDKLDPSKIKGGFRAIYGWGVYFAGTIYKASDYGDMITFLNSKALKFLKVNNDVTSGLISELGKIKDKNIYYDLFVDKLKNMVGIEINEARLRMGDFIRWDYNELWSQMFMDAGYDGFNQNDNEYVVFNIDKANQAILEDPLNVTTKSQKIVVNTIPGYERMMGEVEGILDKTMNRTGSYNQATASAIGYIQKSAVYERADDSQREQIIRDFVKLRGEKIKVAPSVGKIMGEIKDVKKVTVNEKTALKDQIKLEVKAAKDAVAFVKQLRMQISGRLKMMAGRGVISAKQASTILARYDRMNILNPDMRDRFVDYMANVFQSAEYADKVKEANKLRKTIRKAAKSPDNQAENSKMAKSFAEIDPSRVENIDDYLNNAEQMLKAVSRKTGDVKMRSLINMTDMVSYIDGEIQEQRKQIKNEILSKYQDLVDAGVLDSKMTINEIQKVVDAIEENEDESAAKAKEAKTAVKQMMDEVSPILLQIARTGEDPFTGDPIDLTQDEKAAIVKLAKMDIDNLSLAEAVKALEYANNFVSNGIFSGIGAIVSVNEGSLEPAKLKKEGVMSRRLRKYFSPKAGRAWAEQLGSLPMLNKLLFLSNEKAIKVAEASGVTGISVGKAKAIKIVEKAVKEYTDKFSSIKDFRTGENIIERGILAFVSRTVIGDKFQVQDEFNRRKSLIEETIQALTDPNNSTDADIKKGELIEKVYDKILKDAKNVNDVRAKVSDVNKKAVDWWVNEWSKHYDRMDEVSRSVYNTLLTRDANFTPDRFQSIDLTTASENDFESSFFSGYENVSTDKSGSLKENKRIKNLPSDKNGNKTRIVNLDFDMNNANALTNALIDVETASSVLKAKGFATSKDFGKIFSSKDDAKLYKRRLISYVNNVKGKSYVDQSELTNMGKALNVIGSFGTAKALFSLSQPFKQSIPPLFNTLVQTGRNDIGTLFSGGNEFIDKTGYPIVNRGISSLAELQAVNKKIAEAEKNLLAKGIMGIAEYNNKMLEIWLQKPDVFTARSSWLSFYIDSLKKQGITTRGIDWKTHEMNKKAADYAQLMVDSQQNVSDSDMQGMLLTDKTPYAKAVRKALFTLMTFTLNQKTRIWSDMRTLSNKKLTSEADRKEALLSLGGAIVELVSFHSISLSVAYIVLQPLVDAMMEALGYEDEEEDKELEKKKLLMNKMASLTQSFLKDFILPPMPIVGSIASGKVNEIMDEYGVSEKIAVEGFGIEDGESKFKMYDREDYSFIDALGPAGIAAEKGKELFDFSALASTGKFDVETRGGLVTKQILEENEDLAKINASIMSAYYLGILPGELAYIARKLDKKIKKGAEVVEEEED